MTTKNLIVFKTMYGRILSLAILLILSSIPGKGQIQKRDVIIKDTILRVPSREWPHYADKKTLAVVFSNGVILSDTSKLRIGKGSLPTGDFRFIAKYFKTATKVLEISLKRSTTSKMMEVQKITRRKTGNNTFEYDVLCIGGYQVQLAKALSSGEVAL